MSCPFDVHTLAGIYLTENVQAGGDAHIRALLLIIYNICLVFENK